MKGRSMGAALVLQELDLEEGNKKVSVQNCAKAQGSEKRLCKGIFYWAY